MVPVPAGAREHRHLVPLPELLEANRARLVVAAAAAAGAGAAVETNAVVLGGNTGVPGDALERVDHTFCCRIVRVVVVVEVNRHVRGEERKDLGPARVESHPFARTPGIVADPDVDVIAMVKEAYRPTSERGRRRGESSL